MQSEPRENEMETEVVTAPTGKIGNPIPIMKQVPRLPGGHRPFNTSTLLSQLMLKKGVRVAQVMIATGVHQRMMTEYLARRSKPSAKSVNLLARYFRVDAAELVDEDGFLKLAPGYEDGAQGKMRP